MILDPPLLPPLPNSFTEHASQWMSSEDDVSDLYDTFRPDVLSGITALPSPSSNPNFTTHSARDGVGADPFGPCLTSERSASTSRALSLDAHWAPCVNARDTDDATIEPPLQENEPAAFGLPSDVQPAEMSPPMVST